MASSFHYTNRFQSITISILAECTKCWSCSRGTHEHQCHASQLGLHVRVPFPSSSQVVHVFILFTVTYGPHMFSMFWAISIIWWLLMIALTTRGHSPCAWCSILFLLFLNSPYGLPLSLIAPLRRSNVTTDVSLITLPPVPSFFPTVFGYDVLPVHLSPKQQG